MSLYTDLTDEELTAEIERLRTVIRGDDTAGIRSVAGEGRRVEYFSGGTAKAERLLRLAVEEQSRRAGGLAGRAIGVNF